LTPSYDHGSTATLTAHPAAGFPFPGWSPTRRSSDHPLNVVMDAAKHITATFAINTYALDVATVGNGTVAKSPDQPSYDHGSTVQLTATPAAGFHFTGWSGDASGSDNPLNVLKDATNHIT